MQRQSTFTITPKHLALLQRMNVIWEDCEYGAPAIDCKRPYGNSDVEEDIFEILHIEPAFKDEDEPDEVVWSRKQRNEAAALHREMETVLQICLTTQSFRPGTYVQDPYNYTSWARSDPS